MIALVTTSVIALAAAWVTSRWDGSHNLPSDATVDKLVAEAHQRLYHGESDPDELMPRGRYTHGEYRVALRTPLLISDRAIDDAAKRPAKSRRQGPVRAWLAGGYNMPSEAKINVTPPHTKRGRHVGPLARDAWFKDERRDPRALPNPTGLGL